MILVSAVFNGGGVSASPVGFCVGARREAEANGADVDEQPPALRLSAPGKMNNVVRVCIVLERHRVPARKSLQILTACRTVLLGSIGSSVSLTTVCVGAGLASLPVYSHRFRQVGHTELGRNPMFAAQLKKWLSDQGRSPRR